MLYNDLSGNAKLKAFENWKEDHDIHDENFKNMVLRFYFEEIYADDNYYTNEGEIE